MATLQTTLTPLGYQTLMKKGLVNNIIYYNINDNYHNYTVSADENLVPGVNGKHSQITTSYCNFAEYSGVFSKTPSATEIQNAVSRVQYSFVNEDCSYGNFNQPNLNINININSWLTQLSASTYNFDMGGLTLDLWDYVTATVQTLNLSTKNYDNVRYLTNLGLSWSPKTIFDLNNLTSISPRYVQLAAGNTRQMVDNSNIRFGSPFFLSFSTYSVNGTATNNTAGRFSLVPNEVGYWVNGNTFLSTTTVETSDLSTYTTVTPAAKVGSNIYYLSDNTSWPTKAGFIGYALKMVKTDGSGETLLTGLINQAKLFMKTYGFVGPSHLSGQKLYTIPVTMNVIATNPEINFITDKFGGNVRLNFIYDPTYNNKPIIELL